MNHSEFQEFSLNDEAVYINGSGGFNPMWSGTPFKQLQKTLNRKEGISIIGPSTVSEDIDFLKKEFDFLNHCDLKNKVYFFTRELKSYEILKSILPGWVELDHDHDTALNLEVEDVYNHPLGDQYVYYAIRDDRESQEFKKFSPFIFWEDPVKLTKTFDDWVNIHANARQIITNRTHSTILGAILGKKVTMLPNSYHKNRSIWEYSLSSKGVVWAEELKINRFIKTLMKTKAYSKLCYSYKFRQLNLQRNGLSAYTLP